MDGGGDGPPRERQWCLVGQDTADSAIGRGRRVICTEPRWRPVPMQANLVGGTCLGAPGYGAFVSWKCGGASISGTAASDREGNLLLTAEENYGHEHLRAQVTSILVAASFVLIGLALDKGAQVNRLYFAAVAAIALSILNTMVVVAHTYRFQRHVEIARSVREAAASTSRCRRRHDVSVRRTHLEVDRASGKDRVHVGIGGHDGKRQGSNAPAVRR